MIRGAGICGVAVAALLTFSGCSAPPIAPEISHELQTQVQEIAFLTARGDTADAVAAAHTLAGRVRTAQTEGRITAERAIMILQRVEQLIDRLVRSGAAPAPADMPQPVAGPVVPAAPAEPSPPPSPEVEPEEEPEPELSDTDDPEPAEPSDDPGPVAPEPALDLVGDATVGDAGNSGSGSGNSGSSGSGPGPAAPLPLRVDATNDDNGGKGRGRGRGND